MVICLPLYEKRCYGFLSFFGHHLCSLVNISSSAYLVHCEKAKWKADDHICKVNNLKLSFSYLFSTFHIFKPYRKLFCSQVAFIQNFCPNQIKLLFVHAVLKNNGFTKKSSFFKVFS